MKTAVVLRATQACLFAGTLGLMNLSANAAPDGAGGGGGGGGGPPDPCIGNAYREICETFETSLHKTRFGKPRHYNAEYGGFELLTGVPYDELVCKNCHNPANTTTPLPYEPSCYDCHVDSDDNDSNPFNDPVPEATCRGCHSRQNAETNMFTDVHRAAGMTCMDCHHKSEMHGDGIAYESMQEPGALKVSCTQAGCHSEQEMLLPLRPGRGKNQTPVGVSKRALSFHKKHLEEVDCGACHAQSVVACDSCHFDSEVVEKKRFYRQIPQSGFKFLMNKDGKVKTATYQSLTWGSSDPEIDDVSFYVLEPFSGHTVSDGTNVVCEDCHVRITKIPKSKGQVMIEGNAALTSYLTNGTINVNRWEPETVDDGDPNTYGKLLAPQGVIPVVPDWEEALLFDFVYWTGDPNEPVVRDPAAAKWNFLKSGADMVHMPYGSPLTDDQIDRLSRSKLNE